MNILFRFVLGSQKAKTNHIQQRNSFINITNALNEGIIYTPALAKPSFAIQKWDSKGAKLHRLVNLMKNVT